MMTIDSPMLALMPTQALNNPLTDNQLWHPAGSLSSQCAVLNDWLLNTGSLTERLKSRCRDFRVQLVSEKLTAIHPDEGALLLLADPRAVVREVCLLADGMPWVFARTLVSEELFYLAEKGLSTLGTKPLGSIIFNDPQFVRQGFELSKIQSQDNWLERQQIESAHPIWARRSIFSYYQQRMMVTEVFLPSAPAYDNYRLNFGDKEIK